MSDYKELFYQSQAKLADAIDELDSLSQSLKEFMVEAEESVISKDSTHPDNKSSS